LADKNNNHGSGGNSALSVASSLVMNSSVMSEVDENEHEIITLLKFGAQGVLEDPSTTIEAQLLHKFNDHAFVPDVPQVLNIIKENPTSSILLLRGKKGLDSNVSLLHTKMITSDHMSTQHHRTSISIYEEEQVLMNLKNQADEKVHLAEMERDALEASLEAKRTNRLYHEEQKRAQDCRARVCACLHALTTHMKGQDFSPFSGDFDIMEVRRLLGLTSPAACAQLSQGQCLGTLHILHICKYVSNHTFMGFWVLRPPEGCGDVASWQELYGRYPQVKTCKESLPILQKRISNYLGMPDPRSLPILSPHMSQEEAVEAFDFLTQFTGIGAVGRNTAHNAGGETADDAGKTKTADDDDGNNNNGNDNNGSEPGNDAGSN
jgi:hypothetical protein